VELLNARASRAAELAHRKTGKTCFASQSRSLLPQAHLKMAFSECFVSVKSLAKMNGVDKRTVQYCRKSVANHMVASRQAAAQSAVAFAGQCAFPTIIVDKAKWDEAKQTVSVKPSRKKQLKSMRGQDKKPSILPLSLPMKASSRQRRLAVHARRSGTGQNILVQGRLLRFVKWAPSLIGSRLLDLPVQVPPAPLAGKSAGHCLAALQKFQPVSFADMSRAASFLVVVREGDDASTNGQVKAAEQAKLEAEAPDNGVFVEDVCLHHQKHLGTGAALAEHLDVFSDMYCGAALFRQPGYLEKVDAALELVLRRTLHFRIDEDYDPMPAREANVKILIACGKDPDGPAEQQLLILLNTSWHLARPGHICKGSKCPCGLSVEARPREACVVKISELLSLLVFGTLPPIPVMSRWTRAVLCSGWFALGMAVHQVLRKAVGAALDKGFRVEDLDGPTPTKDDMPEGVAEFQAKRKSRIERLVTFTTLPSAKPRVIFLAKILQPCEYFSQWLSLKKSPLLDLLHGPTSPIVAVLQHLTGLLTAPLAELGLDCEDQETLKVLPVLHRTLTTLISGLQVRVLVRVRKYKYVQAVDQRLDLPVRTGIMQEFLDKPSCCLRPQPDKKLQEIAGKVCCGMPADQLCEGTVFQELVRQVADGIDFTTYDMECLNAACRAVCRTGSLSVESMSCSVYLKETHRGHLQAREAKSPRADATQHKSFTGAALSPLQVFHFHRMGVSSAGTWFTKGAWAESRAAFEQLGDAEQIRYRHLARLQRRVVLPLLLPQVAGVPQQAQTSPAEQPLQSHPEEKQLAELPEPGGAVANLQHPLWEVPGSSPQLEARESLMSKRHAGSNAKSNIIACYPCCASDYENAVQQQPAHRRALDWDDRLDPDKLGVAPVKAGSRSNGCVDAGVCCKPYLSCKWFAQARQAMNGIAAFSRKDSPSPSGRPMLLAFQASIQGKACQLQFAMLQWSSGRPLFQYFWKYEIAPPCHHSSADLPQLGTAFLPSTELCVTSTTPGITDRFPCWGCGLPVLQHTNAVLQDLMPDKDGDGKTWHVHGFDFAPDTDSAQICLGQVKTTQHLQSWILRDWTDSTSNSMADPTPLASQVEEETEELEPGSEHPDEILVRGLQAELEQAVGEAEQEVQQREADIEAARQRLAEQAEIHEASKSQSGKKRKERAEAERKPVPWGFLFVPEFSSKPSYVTEMRLRRVPAKSQFVAHYKHDEAFEQLPVLKGLNKKHSHSSKFAGTRAKRTQHQSAAEAVRWLWNKHVKFTGQKPDPATKAFCKKCQACADGTCTVIEDLDRDHPAGNAKAASSSSSSSSSSESTSTDSDTDSEED